MNFTFAKSLLAGSLVAMGAFGLVACGDDSSTNSSDSKQTPVEIPTEKAPNIIVTDTAFRQSGDDIRFKGKFSLDFTDETNENSSNLRFTTISFMVVDAANIQVNATVNYNANVVPTANVIDLHSERSAFVKLSLLDTAFTTCGDFKLIVNLNANDGVKDYPTTETIGFTRPADEYCKDPTIPSSSSEPEQNEIMMTSCQVELSTNINPGLDFASCQAVPAASAATADVFFKKTGKKSDRDVSITSGSGVLFAPITNADIPPYDDDYDVDNWPEDVNERNPPVAYVSDFQFRSGITKSEITEIMQNTSQIYVAKTALFNEATGAGFYAFGIVNPSLPDANGDYTFTVKLYKVQ